MASILNLFPNQFSIEPGEIISDENENIEGRKAYVAFKIRFNNEVGNLCMTNYRMIFQPLNQDKPSEEIFWGSVYIFDFHKRPLELKIEFKDARPDVTIVGEGLKNDFENFKKYFSHFAFPKDYPAPWDVKNEYEDIDTNIFAFAYGRHSSEIMTTSHFQFDMESEMKRILCGEKSENVDGPIWQPINNSPTRKDQIICETYPDIIYLPREFIKNFNVLKAASYRSKNRLPILSWLDSNSQASITRCSQPLTGVSGSVSSDDIALCQGIQTTNKNKVKLKILDARPLANAYGNRANHGGFENADHYDFADLTFLKIDNIHTMRDSLRKLKAACAANNSSTFWSDVENSRWLEHIKQILKGATRVVEHINNKNSVLIHCSDGWDRTSQLTSLSMLMLDSYYRSIKGFIVLIEKEWVSFGHKFRDRCGNGLYKYKERDEKSPVFMQFIECVWQIMQQFPTSFEFNQYFLLEILKGLYSFKYGTFLSNTEFERRKKYDDYTVSLWDELLREENIKSLINPLFNDGDHSVIIPAPFNRRLKLFTPYFCQYQQNHQPHTDLGEFFFELFRRKLQILQRRQ